MEYQLAKLTWKFHAHTCFSFANKKHVSHGIAHGIATASIEKRITGLIGVINGAFHWLAFYLEVLSVNYFDLSILLRFCHQGKVLKTIWTLLMV